MSNSVKLYSNGTAVYTRQYPLDGKNPTKISIPVRKPDLDEVVASIAVFGNVRLPYPPSYTPVNAAATALKIDPKSALKDTVTKLAGAEVEIVATGSEKVRGKLVGAHTYEETNANGMTSERMKVVVLTDKGVTMTPESNIVTLSFTDATTQDEYNKALAAAYQSVKPDSSFVDLTVVAEGDTKTAAVTYATPVAAWKPRYQLRTVGGVMELQSEAVVDNDTEDEWKDSIISVITGEPIAFETDLAEIRRPIRQKINVVSDKAQGAVGVEDTVRRPNAAPQMKRAVAPMGMALRSMGGGGAVEMCDAEYSGGELECVAASSFGGAAPKNQAAAVNAEVRESGDFSIFTSPNSVTIGSKKSAIIPMFRAFLAESKTVLVYNPKNDARRPFRAVKFKNETKNPLGKGVCEIYLENDFQGKSILEATAPGQESFLVHAKENGVKVHTGASEIEYRRTGIKIKDGVVSVEQASSADTTYTVTNTKAEPFDFEIEHARRLPSANTKLEASVSGGQAVVNETPSGWRISVTLPSYTGPKTGEIEVTLTENSLDASVYQLGYNGVNWLNQNIIATKNPLARNKGIQNVIALQAKLDDINFQIEQADERESTLTADQERLLKLIPSGHATQADKWKTELGTNENDLRTLTRETQPDLKKQQRAAQQAVNEALAELTAKWTEKEKVNGEPVAVNNDEQ
jgi:hypothetical protein